MKSNEYEFPNSSAYWVSISGTGASRVKGAQNQTETSNSREVQPKAPHRSDRFLRSQDAAIPRLKTGNFAKYRCDSNKGYQWIHEFLSFDVLNCWTLKTSGVNSFEPYLYDKLFQKVLARFNRWSPPQSLHTEVVSMEMPPVCSFG